MDKEDFEMKLRKLGYHIRDPLVELCLEEGAKAERERTMRVIDNIDWVHCSGTKKEFDNVKRHIKEELKQKEELKE